MNRVMAYLVVFSAMYSYSARGWCEFSNASYECDCAATNNPAHELKSQLFSVVSEKKDKDGKVTEVVLKWPWVDLKTYFYRDSESCRKHAKEAFEEEKKTDKELAEKQKKEDREKYGKYE